jgi:TonB family protein
MTEPKDNSSLPLLLSITGAVLVVAVGGWFFLDEDTPPPPVVPSTTVPGLAATTPGGEPADAEPKADENVLGGAAVADASTTDAPPELATMTEPDDDAAIRKARLAADADILVFPENQSALHYYGRVLNADPGNEVAMAELDAVLTRVAQTVTQSLEAEEFEEAYAIAVLVAKQKPEHPLVRETQQTLDAHTENLVAKAIQHVQDGNDAQADEVLAAAAALPDRNPGYFVAIRESMAEIREVRQAADRDRNQRAQMAANQARAAWVESVRRAIAQGNLIEPAGASAHDLLAESNNWSAERGQLTSELLTALTETAQSNINNNRLDGVEALLVAASELGGEPVVLDDIRASLERAYIEAKSSRIAQMTELVQIKREPVRYPRRALRLNLTGWVDVLFTITPSGKTADIEINRADPESVFDDAAIAAVEDWEFEPVEYRGQLISQRAGTRIVFQLE